MHRTLRNGLATVTACAVVASGAYVAWAAKELVIVSWGGAYSASQQKAYHDPYMKKNSEIKILNDDSANEGVAKLRAQAEAKNTTWDLVDVVASDAIRLCDEGLAMEIDHDKVLAAAPDGTPVSMTATGPGLAVDKLLLTDDADYVPEGKQKLDGTPPATPQGLAITGVRHFDVSLNWQPVASDLHHFQVYRSGAPEFQPGQETLVADTPGFRELGFWRIHPDDLDQLFPEFAPYIPNCKFSVCSHSPEPDCAVRAAVEAGELDAERYDSYLRLLRDLRR